MGQRQKIPHDERLHAFLSSHHLLEAGFLLLETTLSLVSQMIVRVGTKWLIGPGTLGISKAA